MRLIMSLILIPKPIENGHSRVCEIYDIPLANFELLCWTKSTDGKEYWNEACDFYDEIMWDDVTKITEDQKQRLREIEIRMKYCWR